MRVVTSLTNRIFLACTLLAALSLGFAFYFVNARMTDQAEAELRRGLTDAAALVDQIRLTLLDRYTRDARLVADQSNLKAAVATNDPPTVQPLAEDYRTQVIADVIVISSAPSLRNHGQGRVLASIGSDGAALPIIEQAAATTNELSVFLPHKRGILQVTSVPIFQFDPDRGDKDVLGRLTLGFFLDDARAGTFKALTGSDVAFSAGGRILASTLPPGQRSALAAVLRSSGIARVRVGRDDYLALATPLHAEASVPASPDTVPRVIVLRSRTERLRFLKTLQAGLGGAFVVTVILATILSYAIARTVSRPVAAVTSAMRDVAATGDLTRKVLVRSRAWDDEDALVLATAFNTLTESIARFQREAALKDRLSSLGRLSTVIAHEVRNPLMIIRATLTTLMRDDLSAADIREAVADIDEETKRLNRVVSEVLDFAKPIRFDLTPAGINEICRASVVAAWEGHPNDEVTFDLDERLPSMLTDAERLRTALVNILSNARHALHAARDARAPVLGAGTRAGVIVSTRGHGDRVRIAITDRGVGITPEDMAHIFDPYFTTRRAGTGLGLPISKNIVEGLGGSLGVSSRVGEGTEIVIDLPLRAAGAAA